MKNLLSITGGLILVGYLIVSFFSGLYNVYDDCVKNEGWLKGFTFCENDHRESFTVDMVSGFLWPINIGVGIIANNSSDSLSIAKNKPLTVSQRETIAKRCSYVVATNKRRYPNVLGPSFELCFMSHKNAALEGKPSLLSMAPSDYKHYIDSRDLAPEEAQSMVERYAELANTCSVITVKTMLVQPIVKGEFKKTIHPKHMAVLVTDWDPKIPKANLIHRAVLTSHFRDYGLYGTRLEYFLDEFESCVGLSTAVLGLLREKDRRSERITQTTNKYRADIAEMFQASQGLRDKIYGKK